VHPFPPDLFWASFDHLSSTLFWTSFHRICFRPVLIITFRCMTADVSRQSLVCPTEVVFARRGLSLLGGGCLFTTEVVFARRRLSLHGRDCLCMAEVVSARRSLSLHDRGCLCTAEAVFARQRLPLHDRCCLCSAEVFFARRRLFVDLNGGAGLERQSCVSWTAQAAIASLISAPRISDALP
jgi:hypothetical protein